MTSILVHTILQGILMLATSDICPEREWYGEDLNTPDTEWTTIDQCFIKDAHNELRPVSCDKRHQKRVACEIPLAETVTASDVRNFYRLARKMAGR